MYLKFQIKIKVPGIMEAIIIYFLLRYRKRKHGYPFRKIKLTQGLFAIVDPEDYEKLNKYKWFAKIDERTYYAARIENGKKIYMHRQIKQPPRGFVVDHINHKGFDNRKANLQIVTPAENNYNSRKQSKITTSIYKGVSKCKSTGKWRAVIHVNGIDMHLGYYESEIEAAKAYDEAARRYRGEFAVLNFTTEKNEVAEKLGPQGFEPWTNGL